MLAFMSLGVNVENYYAYEIDKYAIKTTEHNFPNIKQCGDVFEADFTQYKDIDYLIGGSPCTFWSIAQSPDKRETTASGLGWELFSQYVRALNEAKPKYFLYENNKSMSKAIYKSISEAFGFEPILINSALVSAQNRNRYYWCGKRNDDGTYNKVDIPQPEDKGILLKDVLDNAIRFSRKIGVCEPKDKSLVICASDWRGINRNQVQNAVAEPVGTTKDEKSYCLTSGYANGSGENIGNYAVHTLEKGCKSMVAEPVCMRYERSETAKRLRKDYESGKIKHGFHEHSELHPRTDGKSNTLSTVLKDNPICEPVNTTIDGKSQWLRATCYKDTVRNIVGNNVDRKTGVAEKVSVLPKSNNEPSAPPIEPQFEFQDLIIRDKAHIAINENAIRGVQNKNNASCAENFYEFTDTKANTLTTAHKPKIIDELDNYKRYAEPCEWNDNGEPTKAISFADGKKYVVYSIVDGQIEIKGKTYPIKLKDGYYIIRKLTVKECMRLQTVPEWYDFSAISNSQAYKCLGNGWTIEVIKHLLKYYLNE